MEIHRGKLLVTDEFSKLDCEFVVRELQATYWANHRSKDTIIKSMENSLCYGLFDQGKQIGFARIITDFVTYAYLCDVIVATEYRGQKLGEFLVNSIIEDPRLSTCRFALFTKDAQEFYRKKFGFAPHKFDALVREPRVR